MGQFSLLMVLMSHGSQNVNVIYMTLPYHLTPRRRLRENAASMHRARPQVIQRKPVMKDETA